MIPLTDGERDVLADLARDSQPDAGAAEEAQGQREYEAAMDDAPKRPASWRCPILPHRECMSGRCWTWGCDQQEGVGWDGRR